MLLLELLLVFLIPLSLKSSTFLSLLLSCFFPLRLCIVFSRRPYMIRTAAAAAASWAHPATSEQLQQLNTVAVSAVTTTTTTTATTYSPGPVEFPANSGDSLARWGGGRGGEEGSAGAGEDKIIPATHTHSLQHGSPPGSAVALLNPFLMSAYDVIFDWLSTATCTFGIQNRFDRKKRDLCNWCLVMVQTRAGASFYRSSSPAQRRQFER